MVGRQRAFRDRRAADTVEAIAAGDEVTFERFFFSLIGEMNCRALGIQPLDQFRIRLEQ